MLSFFEKYSLKSAFCEALRKIEDANFKVIFWDGSIHDFGAGNDFTIHIKNKAILRRIFFDPSVGFGEGYMNGDIEVEGDLRQIVRIGLVSSNLAKRNRKKILFNAVKQTVLERNTKRTDKQFISHHYDLGNDFYQLWLDPQMVYSCAYFKNDSYSLEQAQIEKIRLCCQKLRLKSNEHLLDIGCGWGSLLINAAKDFGIRGVGITLSKEQLAYGREQIAKEGLQDRLHLEFLDYRDLSRLQQTFDKIVSVGMFEHVGKSNMLLFLESARKVLRPTGLFLLHTIGKTVEEPTNSWIRKYIFPGCYLPDIGSIMKHCTNMGLSFIDCENMRIHYSKTLDSWREQFEKNETKVRSMFDERFIRMWRFYLAGCSAVFRYGGIHLFQLLFSAGVRNDLPLTREWLCSKHPITGQSGPIEMG
jgi:cyclopropane-fatty-acyl-phospholipid synthase